MSRGRGQHSQSTGGTHVGSSTERSPCVPIPESCSGQEPTTRWRLSAEKWNLYKIEENGKGRTGKTTTGTQNSAESKARWGGPLRADVHRARRVVSPPPREQTNKQGQDRAEGLSSSIEHSDSPAHLWRALSRAPGGSSEGHRGPSPAGASSRVGGQDVSCLGWTGLPITGNGTPKDMLLLFDCLHFPGKDVKLRTLSIIRSL